MVSRHNNSKFFFSGISLLSLLAASTVLGAPIITLQPQPQTCILGARAVFGVVAAGTEPLAYEWRKDGKPILSATNRTFSINQAQFSDAGPYSVAVSDTEGESVSAAATLTVNWPSGGDIDFSFDVGSSIDGPVSAIAVQPDDRILIGGRFTTVHGAARLRLARLNSDGSTDLTFMHGIAGADNWVRCMAVASDGKIFVAGEFSDINETGRAFVTRLNADGSRDADFVERLAPDAGITSMALQQDGRLLIAGYFGSVNDQPRSRIARLNSDGSLDTTFQQDMSGANDTIESVTIQADGKVLIAGAFTAVNDVARGRIARLNTDGSVDESFQAEMEGADNTVEIVIAQPDGRVLAGGSFTSINGQFRSGIARLKADGSLDKSFQHKMSGVDSTVETIALQPHGEILIGGTFTMVNGIPRQRVARLLPHGKLDLSFQLETADEMVESLIVQSDERVLIGGSFTTLNGMSRERLTRLNSDGSLDDSFKPGPSGPNSDVLALAVQPDNKVVIAGTFTNVSAAARNRIARLNTDGSVDITFLDGLEGANDTIHKTAIQPDGKIVVGGRFTDINGASRGRIARLNANGSLDATFQNAMSGADATVEAVLLQADGKTIIGGTFTSVNGQARNRLARLNLDGSVDSSFVCDLTEPNDVVLSLAQQSDGKVLIGGVFRFVAGVSRNGIARLLPNGALDRDFQEGMPGSDGPVLFITVQPDGRSIVAGGFGTFNRTGRYGLARLNSDGSLDGTFEGRPELTLRALVTHRDGKVLIGGAFSDFYGNIFNRMLQINPDGGLDTNFQQNLGPGTGWIYTLAIDSHGKALIGGSFTSVNGAAMNRVGRLYPDRQGPPVIASSPLFIYNLYEGAPAILAARADGSLPLQYQWQQDGRDLVDDGNITGANSNTLAISRVRTTDAGIYTLVVSNIAGTASTSGTRLRVQAAPPSISRQPQNGFLETGQTATLIIDVVGTLPFTYQWQKNGTPLLDDGRIVGTRSNILQIRDFQTSDAGIYRAVIDNARGSATTVSALLTAVNSFMFSATNQITIPALGIAAPYPSTLLVSGVTSPVVKVIATLSNIIHTWPGDIDVLLAGPLGQTVLLMSDAGEGHFVGNATLVFDDHASSKLPDRAQIVPGTYRPSDYGSPETLLSPAPADPYGLTLAVFNGVSPNGEWRLFVRDDTDVDKGSIAGGWSLRVLVPLVGPPLPTPIIRGTNINLQFLSLTGSTYRVQFKNSLSETSWQTLRIVLGNGGLQTIQEFTTNATQRFYRLEMP